MPSPDPSRAAKASLYDQLLGNISLAALLASLNSSSGSDLVFSTVKITEATAGIASLGVGATGEVVRLHGLYITARSQCTVTVGYDDDGVGTTPVTLEGPESVGAGGSPHIGPTDKDSRGKLTTGVDKYMTVTFATAGGDGYAIISKGPA